MCAGTTVKYSNVEAKERVKKERLENVLTGD
jgi:hypothetical protein